MTGKRTMREIAPRKAPSAKACVGKKVTIIRITQNTVTEATEPLIAGKTDFPEMCGSVVILLAPNTPHRGQVYGCSF